MAATTHRIRAHADGRRAKLDQLLDRQLASLQSRRQVLRDDVPSATQGVTDLEEQCLAAEEEGVGFSVLQQTARTLQQIEAALGRLAAGVHGICSECRAPISGARLRAMPFAALCLTCQERLDGTSASDRRR